jgi:hypothetical protein
MIVGFTGTRDGMTNFQKSQFINLLWEWRVTELHHGMSGKADAEAHDLARRCGPAGIWIVGHPSTLEKWYVKLDVDWENPREKPLVRNRDIVDESQRLIAAPKGDEVLRSGTWSTVRYARKLNRECRILAPRWEDAHV